MAFTKLTPEELRRHKGVSFTGITTIFFCHDGNGRLFFTKRSKNARDEPGRWEQGGGGLKHGQAVEANMCRELLEEYGVEPLKTDFIGYFDSFRTSADGTPTHWVVMCFAIKVDPKKVKISEPDMVDDSGWFTFDKLPRPTHSKMDLFMEIHGPRLKQIMERD